MDVGKKGRGIEAVWAGRARVKSKNKKKTEARKGRLRDKIILPRTLAVYKTAVSRFLTFLVAMHVCLDSVDCASLLDHLAAEFVEYL